jgi:hypothetical protein
MQYDFNFAVYHSAQLGLANLKVRLTNFMIIKLMEILYSGYGIFHGAAVKIMILHVNNHSNLFELFKRDRTWV